MTAAKTKAPREKLTLRDGVDLYLAVDRYVEEHIDEIELNGGALPDDLAAMLDEIDAATKDRVDALAAKIDQFTGSAAAAKATKDRAARREKVWNNAIAAIKGYATLQTQRAGGRLEGTVAVLRMQRNGQASVELTVPSGSTHASEAEFLLAIVDAEETRRAGIREGQPTAELVSDALAHFITVQRVATLDRRALGAAYEARRAELEADVTILDESDISDADEWRIAEFTANAPDGNRADAVEGVLAEMRAKYIADNLAAEFPGVRVERGSHLRID